MQRGRRAARYPGRPRRGSRPCRGRRVAGAPVETGEPAVGRGVAVRLHNPARSICHGRHRPFRPARARPAFTAASSIILPTCPRKWSPARVCRIQTLRRSAKSRSRRIRLNSSRRSSDLLTAGLCQLSCLCMVRRGLSRLSFKRPPVCRVRSPFGACGESVASPPERVGACGIGSAGSFGVRRGLGSIALLTGCS
jgi:hypothetical protein